VSLLDFETNTIQDYMPACDYLHLSNGIHGTCDDGSASVCDAICGRFMAARHCIEKRLGVLLDFDAKAMCVFVVASSKHLKLLRRAGYKEQQSVPAKAAVGHRVEVSGAKGSGQIPSRVKSYGDKIQIVMAGRVCSNAVAVAVAALDTMAEQLVVSPAEIAEFVQPDAHRLRTAVASLPLLAGVGCEDGRKTASTGERDLKRPVLHLSAGNTAPTPCVREHSTLPRPQQRVDILADMMRAEDLKSGAMLKLCKDEAAAGRRGGGDVMATIITNDADLHIALWAAVRERHAGKLSCAFADMKRRKMELLDTLPHEAKMTLAGESKASLCQLLLEWGVKLEKSGATLPVGEARRLLLAAKLVQEVVIALQPKLHLLLKDLTPKAFQKAHKYFAGLASVNLGFGDVASLTECGASLAYRDTFGRTPLMVQALYGSAETVGALMERGADVFATCNKGYTALHYASTAPVATKLLSGVARQHAVRLCQVQCYDGNTVFHTAKTPDVLGVLCGAYLQGATLRNKMQATPLIVAVCDGRIDTAMRLLNVVPANTLLWKDVHGGSAWMYARYRQGFEVFIDNIVRLSSAEMFVCSGEETDSDCSDA
jgi:hypothetical protein